MANKQKTKKQTLFDERAAQLMEELEVHIEEMKDIEKKLALVKVDAGIETLKDICYYDEYKEGFGKITEVVSPRCLHVTLIRPNLLTIETDKVSITELAEYERIDVEMFKEQFNKTVALIKKKTQI